ncbi:MAG TPA: hypothetical protein VHE32_06685 [Rhodanobacteraceae bacterium]|nr:hypothetical protein [Rhodanobacteraceae bacterium]
MACAADARARIAANAPRAGERWPSYVLALLIAAGTIAFIGIVIDQLVDKGPFGWHLARPRTWQGGIEVLALAALLAIVAGVVRSKVWRALLLVAIGELYLRRHYVDLPMFVDVLYLEALIGTGAFAAKLCGAARAADARGYLRLAAAGIVLWSLGAWTLSAFGIGSIQALRAWTLLFAIPAVVARQTPLTVHLARRFATLGGSERAIVAAIGAWFLCLAARTNLVSGFDAWWYGLRGEYSLVATGSVFRSLELVAPVNYYPKLWELLLIPVSGLHDTSVIEGLSIAVLALVALSCAQILKPIVPGSRTRLLLVALVATVPAIANSALSPKPDLFSAWALLLACIEAAAFAREGRASAFAWTIAGFALAFASKLSAPPYIVAIFAALIGFWWRNGRPRAIDATSERRFAIAIAAAALVVAGFVTARTWLLAGVPLIGPEPLLRLFAEFGLTLKPPAGLLGGGPPLDWHDLPALLVDQLFRPQVLGHMVISWIGNVWLHLFALALVAMLLVRKPADETRARVAPVLIVVLLTGLALLLFYRNPERGGDGNYFVLPVALAIAIGGCAALKRLPEGMSSRLLLATLPLFVVFQAAYSFVSAGWATGTRTFDFDLTRSVLDLPRENARIFKADGIAYIADYLRAVPGTARAVGYVRDRSAFRLPATFETLNFYEYWRQEPLESSDAFVAYLADHGIDYLVMPRDDRDPLKREMAPAVLAAERELRAKPDVKLVEDRGYVLYDLATLHARRAMR